jgi:hypothetical protein
VKSDKSFSKYSRPFVASLLIGGGFLQLAAPVLAAGTPAGTTISNTATASYEDPSDPTKPLNSISNTVSVTVAEVAGITVVADTFSLIKGSTNGTTNTGAAAEANDTVNFDFTVTNVGNDPTKLRIPGTAALTGAGTVTTVQYWNGTIWTNIANAGEYITPTAVAPSGTVKVRVVVSVLATATANSPMSVTLGNTLTPGDQNVLRDATGGDIYTIDDDAAGTISGSIEVAGVPSNGVREGSASQSIIIGATPQSFAQITAVRTANDASSITYNLGLTVANQAPAGVNKLAADLQGTPITLDGGAIAVNKVLVSDAVPTGTTAQTLTIPTGWKAVYTTSPIGTLANAASWITIPGTGTVNVPAGATRVGFIIDGPIVKGTTVTGFGATFAYSSTLATSGGKVANIGQVFGSTTAGGNDVYDESGDSHPNNINDDGINPIEPASNTVTDGLALTTTALADLDTNNNNSGKGPAGEANIFTVVPANQAGITNGTSNKPDAFGPGGNNDDFTNITTPIPTGTGRNALVNPAAIGFANTLKLAGAVAKDISLIPTAPSVTTSLQPGTLVTISYGSIPSKSFIYNGTIFVTPSTYTTVGTGTAATAFVIPAVAPGTNVNYEVTIDMPDISQRTGYGVPIAAFVDSATGVNSNGKPDAGEVQNITIDRIYAGYLQLDKKAQILDKDGTTVIEDYTVTPTKKPAPGQMIRYQITYSNVSDIAPNGSDSVALNAQNIIITEDGAANGNSWSTTTTHKATSADDSSTGILTFNNGTKTNIDPTITVYTDKIGTLVPQGSGTFSFTRIVN